MYRAVMDNIDGADIVVKAAAVADFKPSRAAAKKVKKDAFAGTLKLDRSRDILATIGKMTPKPYLIGFAAETEKLRENARKKMEEKNIDAIVTNDVSRDDIGFSSDYNEANLYFRDGTEVFIPKDEKDAVAFRILESVSKRLAL